MRLQSDSRAEWLAQRRNVLTATEIATCFNSPSAAERLRVEKASGKQSFAGNKFTAHGNEREPIIAEWLTTRPGCESLYPNEDLWISDEDPRIAATPDLVDFNESQVGEIKTVKADIAWDGVDNIPQKYYDQAQVQMYVIGADRCAFAWEVYNVGGAIVKPIPIDDPQYGFIMRDNDRIQELLAWADSYFKKLEETPPDLTSLLERYFAQERVAKAAADDLAETKAALREAMGDKPQAWTYDGLARVSISEPTKRKTFDSTRFKKDNPDLAKEYMKETTSKGALRITAIEDNEG